MMTEKTPISWSKAITDAARSQQIPLPKIIRGEMGSECSKDMGNGRVVTIKRRFIPADKGALDGVEFTLWRMQDDLPVAVRTFRKPLCPSNAQVAEVLPILKGWLLDGWNDEQAHETTLLKLEELEHSPLG